MKRVGDCQESFSLSDQPEINLPESMRKGCGCMTGGTADLEIREVAASHDHGFDGHWVDVVGAGDCSIEGDIVGHRRGPNHGSGHIGPVPKDKVGNVSSPLHTHDLGLGLCIKPDALRGVTEETGSTASHQEYLSGAHLPFPDTAAIFVLNMDY